MSQETEESADLAKQVNNLAHAVGNLERAVTALTEILKEISSKLDGPSGSRP